MTAETVTERKSSVSSGRFAPPLAERETAREVSSVHSWAITVRDRAVMAVGRSRDYWVPPNLLTKPPASVARLSAYAHRAGWTRSTAGTLRALGVLWFRLVGLPVTVWCRYVEFVGQRPGRFLAVLVLWQLAVRSAPGVWLSDHLFHPILAAAAWVFLP